MKILGIDFGDRFIGLALAVGTNAVPYRVIEYDDRFWQEFSTVTDGEGITDIVVGWPKSMSGGENERTEATERFIEALQEHTKLPVHRIDERLTSSAAAARAAHGSGARGRLDAHAAAEILQTYLDTHANPRR